MSRDTADPDDLSEFERDTKAIRPEDYVGMVAFVPNDNNRQFWSWWNFAREKDLSKQIQASGLDITQFLCREDRVKVRQIFWHEYDFDDEPLDSYVFCRITRGKAQHETNLWVITVDTLSFFFSLFRNRSCLPQ